MSNRLLTPCFSSVWAGEELKKLTGRRSNDDGYHGGGILAQVKMAL